ncbi:WAT1-related protein At2g39510-like isoform X1 [Benincasa hispida]|uniref:WAT1-related protein At2g39510-like isoform X1 n=1 Tax=Benincasa hispida TaxID=102211 RepID=UPI00190107BD|nr:WAT1-related protein At2g39510-like isoform X1 [Benincasa hispida]
MEHPAGMLSQAKPYIAVILQQFITAGMVVISKFALNQGLNQHVLVVYRYTIATVVVAPFAFVFERKVRPKMTWSIFGKVVLLGLLEPALDQNLYYTGMKYTTATFASAMTNMVPGLVFLMAWIVRLEKVDVRQLSSQAKILGTVVAVGGAMIMTLVRGPILNLPWTNHNLHDHSSTTANQQDLLKGSLMITIGCILWSVFNVLQAITVKVYPAQLSLTALICFTGAIQASVIAFSMEGHKPAAWSLHLDSTLLAPLYSGIMSSGVSYTIQATVMKTKGPVFASTFSPLSMIIVAIISSFALSEILYFGRVIGAAVIITGLYLVLWGKIKDQALYKLDSEKMAPSDQKLTAITDKPKTSDKELEVDLARIKTVDDSV